jgi:hypothetical protein
MSQILYFLAGRAGRETIDQVLPGRFERSPAFRTVVRGPSDQPAGEILAATDERLELSLGDQDWFPSGCGRFWFGWWRDARPDPVDLQRSQTIPGTPTDSGWLVPRVRKHHLEHGQMVYSIELPRRPRWDGQQFVSGDVAERFRDVADLGGIVNQALDDMHRSAWDDPEKRLVLPPDAPELVARILQINHRVGPDELAALEAFELSYPSLNRILEVFVSRDQFHELVRTLAGDEEEKKSAPVSA